MIFFIIGVLAALVALAVLLLSEEGKAAAFIPGVVAVIMIGVSCVSYVPTGYTGIVTTFGKVEDGTKDAGVVFKSPWQSMEPTIYACHPCKDGSFGVADFQGMRLEGKTG